MAFKHSIPVDLHRLWHWFNAVCSWDWGDAEPLVELIRSKPIPEEFRSAVADIVAGKRKRTRNWHKTEIPAAKRMKVAGQVSYAIELARWTRWGDAEGLEAMSNREGKEPEDIIKEMNRQARKAQADAAKHFDVSVGTIENLLREMRSRIDRWPVV